MGFTQTVKIPDKNFERFLVEEGIDSDKAINGRILRSDVQSVTYLDLYNKKIRSLKGIEAFISLTYLDCRNNYLSRLDLSKNISLNTLYSDVNDLKKVYTYQLSFNLFDY
jgi:Leucine-rich repeat (LRR) protein